VSKRRSIGLISLCRTILIIHLGTNRFGNAVELIVGIVALVQGQLRIVQTSLIGSILSNILLVLGMSFVAGGMFKAESTFQQTAAQASGSIMTLGCVTIAIPAAYQGSVRVATLFNHGFEALQAYDADGDKDAGLLFISRGASLILLFIYGLYLVFQLKTHAFLYEAAEEDEEEEEVPMMTPVASVIGLLAVTVITSFSADYLVGAIDETANEYGIPKAFIGTILLPIVGNAAEHVTSVWMAAKDKMEIAIGVSIGSSIQICLGVIPALVLAGWAIGQPLTLYFQQFETVVLVASVILVNTLIQDGRSNYMEGAMLCSLYLVAALSFWVEPA
jgi:Ca2+:H+ antiporter